jgi:hypothetical protein
MRWKHRMAAKSSKEIIHGVTSLLHQPQRNADL